MVETHIAPSHTDLEHLDYVITHISHVRENCIALGKALIKMGLFVEGRQLIANGHVHDLDKLFGIQWEHMRKDSPLGKELSLAVKEHNHTAKHHPEAFGSIHKMDYVSLAECICDWKARSSEFGGSLMDYIKTQAMKRFAFNESDPVFKTIVEFHDLLCEKPYSQVTP